MDWKVPLADLDYGIEEEEAVLAVLRSKWLTMGGVTLQFESEFADLVQTKHAFAVGNCTQALHLACLALDLSPDDEVILPSLSFVATANAVRYCGATIRFADIIGPEELTIDPNEIERLITPKTKAVIVMHYAGYPCRMNEIMEITEKHGIPVIEDAAHAPGASLDGKPLGSWGVIGCFSFFSNKNLSTGEGGMITTNDDHLAEKIRLMRSHGMTTLTYDRHQGHAFSYDVVELGYNYRIDEIHSALGLAQLHKLEKNNRRRSELVHQYWQGLKDTGLVLPFEEWEAQEQVNPAFHVMPVLLPEGSDRHDFMTKLRDAGIQSSIHYPPTHLFADFKNIEETFSLPRTENVSLREVTIPLYPSMTSEQVIQVLNSIKLALS